MDYIFLYWSRIADIGYNMIVAVKVRPSAVKISLAFCLTVLFNQPVFSQDYSRAETDKQRQVNRSKSVVEVSPYLWATGLKGTIGFGELAVPIDLSVTQLADDIEAGGMGFARWQKGDYSLSAEIIGLEYKDPAFEPLLMQRVSSDLKFANVGVGRIFDLNIGNKVGTITLNAGINYTEINGTISGDVLSQRIDEDWIDLTVGWIAEIALNRNWNLINKTDLAGLEVSDNTLFSSAVIAQRKISDQVLLDVGYRYADAAYPSETGFDLNLKGHGPLLGISFMFGTQTNGIENVR